MNDVVTIHHFFVFLLYMTRHTVRNEHQKVTRQNEIGQCAQNVVTILGSTI